MDEAVATSNEASMVLGVYPSADHGNHPFVLVDGAYLLCVRHPGNSPDCDNEAIGGEQVECSYGRVGLGRGYLVEVLEDPMKCPMGGTLADLVYVV